MYGVWHTKGRSVGGVYYAIVVQSYCNGVAVAGGLTYTSPRRLAGAGSAGWHAEIRLQGGYVSI